MELTTTILTISAVIVTWPIGMIVAYYLIKKLDMFYDNNDCKEVFTCLWPLGVVLTIICSVWMFVLIIYGKVQKIVDGER